MSTKVWISALALAAAGVGCGGAAESVAESTDDTSEELRLGHPKIIEVVEQENYVSDQDEVEALAHDKELVNAWGLAFNPAGPAWISSNGKGLANVYNSVGTRLLRVVVPTPKMRFQITECVPLPVTSLAPGPVTLMISTGSVNVR